MELLLGKLSQLLEKQFGATLTFQVGTDRTAMGNGRATIFFPIQLGNQETGTVSLGPTTNMSTADIERVKRVLQELLSLQIANLDRIHNLSELERNLKGLIGIEAERSSNIIRLQEFRPPQFSLPDFGADMSIVFPILIESLSANDNFKMAMEIHSRSNRYALLPINDLSAETLASATAIQSMGPATIFIPELIKLHTVQQEQLRRYFNIPRIDESPLFLSGTTISLGKLKSEGLVDANLLQNLSIGHIIMNHPFDIYKKQNALEFFYESLVPRSQDVRDQELV